MLRPTVIRNYLSIVESMGYTPGQMLEGTGIEFDRLYAEGEYLIESSGCRKVICNILRLTGNSGVGLDIGGRTDLLSFGITAYALTTCRILRETIVVWRQYSEPLLGMMSRIDVGEDDAKNMTLTISEPSYASPIFVFCVDEFFAMICNLGRAMTGAPHKFIQVELPYPPPAHVDRYEALFQCPIHFNAKQARVTLAKEWVGLPLLAKDADFHKICLEHCGRILHQLRHNSPIAMRLRKAFLDSPQSMPDLEEAARLLGMSARSLRRHLHDEGHSYQSLSRDFKADLAREYLASTNMTAKEVAYFLGFEDVHYFRQAFKAWTGQTVNEYRLSVSQQKDE